MQWDASLYDNNHSFVSVYGTGLLDLLMPAPGERILDLGCGTGDLAFRIHRSGAEVTGVDASAEMVEKARGKYPELDFRVMAAQHLDYEDRFNAVFSNATLHWIPESEKVIRSVFRALKPGGRFVAEMGGSGNVAGIIRAMKTALEEAGEIDRSRKEVFYFPTLAEYCMLLEKAGFRVAFAAYFERPTPLQSEDGMAAWLRMFGAAYLAGLNETMTGAIIRRTVEILKPTHFSGGAWTADYMRLRFMALR